MTSTSSTHGQKRIVFLTGATGFVGSHLARALVARGHEVRALIRRAADRWRLSDLEAIWVEGDLDDGEALRRGCEGASWVIHAAGKVKAPNPEAYLHANHTGTRNVLDAALRAAGIDRFVYISSLAAGGPVRDGRPRAEDNSDEPMTPYGESKLAGEREVMQSAHRLPVVSIRPPAVYGPGDTEVLAFFKAVRWHIKPIFGSRAQCLSLVHVDDLVSGILLACESPSAPGEVFYIAEDRPYTMAELEDMIQAALAIRAVHVHIPRWLLMAIAHAAGLCGRVGGFTPKLNPDKARDFLEQDWTCTTAKANRLLGYRSQVSFADGARQTVAWYRDKGWL